MSRDPVYSDDPSLPLISFIETGLVLRLFFDPFEKDPEKERFLMVKSDFP